MTLKRSELFRFFKDLGRVEEEYEDGLGRVGCGADEEPDVTLREDI